MSRVLREKEEEKYWRCPKDGTYLMHRSLESKEMVCVRKGCGRVWKVRPSGHIRPVDGTKDWQDMVSEDERKRLTVEGVKCLLSTEVVPLVPLKKEPSL